MTYKKLLFLTLFLRSDLSERENKLVKPAGREYRRLLALGSLLFLGLFFLRFSISTLFFNHDVVNHVWWVRSLEEKGFIGFYERGFYPKAPANYPPLANFLFFWGEQLYHLFFGQTLEINNLLASFYKLPSIILETILIVYLVFKKRLWWAIALLFNPAIAYNTLFWGQTEGAITSLIFLSFIAILGKKKLLGFLLFTASILVKQTAFVFLPVFALIAFKKTNFTQKVLGLLLSVIFIWFSFSFFTNKNFLSFPINFYLQTSGGQTHQYLASVNAFNFWYLVGLNNIPDSKTLWGFSFRYWGIFLTILVSLPILIKLIQGKFKLSNILIAAGLVNFAVCLFMTRIHERYLLPTLIFLLPLVFASLVDFIFYALISLAHFLNLYWVWHYPALPIVDFLIGPEFIKILIITNLGIFFYFSAKFLLSKNFDEKHTKKS